MRVDELLEELSSEHSRVPGGGSVAALVVSMSAALLAMAARAAADTWPGAAGAAAQADSIRRRTVPLVAEDARVYEAALAAMKAPVGGTAEERDASIAEALSQAAELPLEIAGAAADAAALAAEVAERGDASLRGDAAAAAVLASGAGRAAANLIAVNLGATGDDPRLTRARLLAQAAEDSARWTLDLERPVS